jgi:serine/threonine protein kinase
MVCRRHLRCGRCAHAIYAQVAAIRAVEREVDVMRSLQHRNIGTFDVFTCTGLREPTLVASDTDVGTVTMSAVRYLGAQVGHDESTTSRCLHIFIELIPGGSLATFIRRCLSFSVDVVAQRFMVRIWTQ